MELITLDLDTPDEMRARWAAYAAVLHARGWGSGVHARDGVWHYDDAAGNWADLYLLDGGRAVFVGNDHESSRTYWGAAAAGFGGAGEEIDILAGVPDWWAAPARTAAGLTHDWVAFAYGFDGTTWSRVPYDVEDGFAALNLPFVGDEQCREHIQAMAEEAGPSDEDVDALIAAGADLTGEQVAAVIGDEDWDADAGVAAARTFR